MSEQVEDQLERIRQAEKAAGVQEIVETKKGRKND